MEQLIRFLDYVGLVRVKPLTTWLERSMLIYSIPVSAKYRSESIWVGHNPYLCFLASSGCYINTAHTEKATSSYEL